MCSFLIKCDILVKKCFAQNLQENCRQNNVCCVILLLMSILGHRIQRTKMCCNDNNSTQEQYARTVRKNSSDEKDRNSLV